MLKLVVRQRLDLREVALCREAEVRLALLVLLELLVDDLPADGLPVLERRKRVAEPRSVGAETTEPAELLPSVRMPQPEPVPCRDGDRPGRPLVGGLDARDQPVAPVEAENVSRLELVLGRELVQALLPGPPSRVLTSSPDLFGNLVAWLAEPKPARVSGGRRLVGRGGFEPP